MLQYSYYNPVDEKAGCVARALSKAFNKEYDEVKKELSHIAKDLNYEDYREIEVFEKYLFDRGAVKENIRNVKIKDLDIAKGIYVVFAYKDDFYHLTCIKNYVLYDKNADILDLIVINLYKLK